MRCCGGVFAREIQFMTVMAYGLLYDIGNPAYCGTNSG